MNIGLIGLQNSGKTTIFNALAKSQAQVSSYANTKSEPNRAMLEVADRRVVTLSEMYHPQKTTFAAIELIDFAGGIGVNNVGHCHPKVVAAIQDQAGKCIHSCFHVAMYAAYVDLAARLNDLAPGDWDKMTLFANSGAEAVENAVKIARAATGRPGVIAFTGGYHGRTLLTLGMTGKISPYKKDVGPFPADIFRAPFPSVRDGISIEDAITGLKNLFLTDAQPDRVAAIAEKLAGQPTSSVPRPKGTPFSMATHLPTLRCPATAPATTFRFCLETTMAPLPRA